jgi:hypothetical protein
MQPDRIGPSSRPRLSLRIRGKGSARPQAFEGMAIARATRAVYREPLFRRHRLRQRKAIPDSAGHLNEHPRDRRRRPPASWLVFCAKRLSRKRSTHFCACTAKTGPISVQPAITKSDSLSTSPGSAICHSKHALSGVAGLIDSMSPGVKLSASYPLCSHGQAPKVAKFKPPPSTCRCLYLL